MATVDETNERLIEEAGRLRVTLGRSDLLIRLFDFILDRTLAGQIPKEIEIAQSVFGKTSDFDMMQDASVRVYIHRLRRKIDEFYGSSSGLRLSLPKGEYRFAIIEPDPLRDAIPGEAPSVPEPAVASRYTRRRILAFVAVLLIANLAAWLAFTQWRPRDPESAAAATFFWRPLTQSARPTFIVIGDYYIFGEAPNAMDVTRLIREFSINSRQDLDEYLMVHPNDRGRFVDVSLHYQPTSAARALRDLLPVVNAAATQTGRPWLLSGSEMSAETLKGVNILYVGFLSGLGILRDPLFEASGFSVGSSYDELVDRASGKHYTSDWGAIADNRTPHRDYAYLASFLGASGNRILIVAGTRDAAVMQAAEIASDKVQLDQLARRVGTQSSFEALYEVQTLGNINLGSTLVLARPMVPPKPGAPPSADQQFPDDTPTGSPDNSTAAQR